MNVKAMNIKAILDRTKLDHEKPGTVHLMVSLNPPEIKEANRKPIDVVVALDTSGSMSDPATAGVGGLTKMTLAKEAVRKFVEQLLPGDRVGLVAYASDVKVLAPLRELTAAHRTQLIEQVARLQAGGATDLVGGALRGLTLLDECAASADRTRRVILFTDGLPTEGITAHREVVAAIGAKLDRRTPISTFGFGAAIVANGAGSGGYDPELLTSIAKMAGGEFYHADGPDGILRAFALELGALRSAAATEVKVEVKPGGKLTVREVLNDCTVATKDGITTIEVGNLYGGEPYHLVVALTVPEVDKTFPRDVLACSVRATGVTTTSGALDEQRDVHFRYVKADEADAKPDPAVEEQRVRLLAAKAVEEAYAKARAGDYAGAARHVQRVAILAVELDTDESRALGGALDAIARDLSSAGSFAARGGSVRAAGASLASRRGLGTGYEGLDRSFTSFSKAGAVRDMGVDPGVSPAAPQPAPAPAASPDPQASQPGPASRPPQGPDKPRSRRW